MGHKEPKSTTVPAQSKTIALRCIMISVNENHDA
jgi:hypothetical protein